MGLFAGNCPHERVLISRLGITLSDAGIDVRRTPPFLNRPPHFIVCLRVGTLLQNLEPIIYRFLFFFDGHFHTSEILFAMKQSRVNEPIISTPPNRIMQKGISILAFSVHIRTSSQVLFYCFNVSVFGSMNQRTICFWIAYLPIPHQQHGYDCCG